MGSFISFIQLIPQGRGEPTTLQSSETDSKDKLEDPELEFVRGSEISRYGLRPLTSNNTECPDFERHHNSIAVLPTFPGRARLSPEIIQASSLHSNVTPKPEIKWLHTNLCEVHVYYF